MKKERPLHLHGKTPPGPPPDLGRLLTAEDVALELFDNQVTPSWVKRTLLAGRVSLGYRTVRWYEKPVRQWIAERMEVA